MFASTMSYPVYSTSDLEDRNDGIHVISPHDESNTLKYMTVMILLKIIDFDLILSFFKWNLILSIAALKAAFMFFVADRRVHFIHLIWSDPAAIV